MVFISKAGSFDIWVGPNEVSPGHGQTRNVLEMKFFLYQVSFTFAAEGYQPK